MSGTRALATHRGRMLAAAALVVLAASGSPAWASQQVDPETLRLLLARAEALLDAGDAEAGMDALERVFARAESEFTLSCHLPGCLPSDGAAG